MAYIALDIGGSAIKAGIVDSEGVISHKTSRPTPMTHFDDLIQVLSELVMWAKNLSQITGIALSQPCGTDPITGECQSEGALIYIKDTNPAKVLGEKFDLPYAAENDGNCAGLAEVWIGNARECKTAAVVVCGTGIGGSFLINGKIVNGKRNFAGEFGMFIVGHDANDLPVNWSAAGSTLALVKSYATLTQKTLTELDGKKIFDRAELGDKVAILCIQSFYKYFSLGLHTIQHALDPERILIGGAISSRPDFILNINLMLDMLYSTQEGFMSRPEIDLCACGPDANMIGAVYNFIKKHGG